MKSKQIRVIVPVVILAAALIAYAVGVELGTLSGFGLGDIALLCPLGSLTTMIASKTLIPKALVSLVIAVIAVLLLGRAFCGWVCPVPAVSKLRGLFKKGQGPQNHAAGDGSAAKLPSDEELKLTDRELAGLKVCSSGCSSCASQREALDSRHFVLGGALLSSAVFGFPVFCLICPIGLTFATLFLVFNLFAHGDTTWTVVIAPALLLAEVVFFKKWCSKICPLSALMSLIGKLNRTFKPAVRRSSCIEASGAVECGRCAKACPEGIDPRHPEQGRSMSECTRCRACADACPTGSLSLPFLEKKES